MDPDLAYDLTAETFLSALDKLRRSRWRGISFGAWLYKVALDQIRAHEKRRAEATNATARLRPCQVPDWELTQDQLQVRRALSKLDDECRTVVTLFYWEDMPVPQIGEVLGKSEKKVKALLTLGLNELKRQLWDYGPEPPDITA